VPHDGRQEGQIVADAVELEIVERRTHGVDGGQPVRRPGAELGDHRIVIHGDLAALEDAGVVADHRAVLAIAFARRAVARQPADRGQEVAVGVLGIEPAFDRPAVELHVVLRKAQFLAGGDADHLLHQIDAGDEFGHRVLDLEAGVHLEEVEVAVPIDDELDGAGRMVADRFRKSDGLRAHGGAGRLVEEGRRRLLDDLLVAALDGAFALAQMDDVAVLVAQHLDLDVARLGDEFLDEDAVVAEGGFGLALGGAEAVAGLLVVPGDAHALAAAAGRRLDHHRIADGRGDADRLVGILDQAHMARHRGDAGFGRELLGGDLVAHRLDGVDGRADEGDALLFQRLGEERVFGQEAVARMDGVGAGLADGVENVVDDDVGLGGRRGADMDGLVGLAHMQRVAVGIGIDRDGGDAELLRGADDPAGDLAAIGYEDFLEHRGVLTRRLEVTGGRAPGKLALRTID
jgi:hypothetical protein